MKISWPSTNFLNTVTRACTVACLSTALTSCDSANVNVSGGAPVSVSVAPMSVHTSYFKDSKSRDFLSLDENVAKDPNYDAFTIWFYHCFADFQTQDEHIDDTAGASTVRLKIKAVQIRLSCPITIWLAQDSTALVREHEQGHVYICRKVYERSSVVAREAARGVVGASYNGMGSNLAEARRMAIAQAEGEIARVFREKIVEIADEISISYDKLCGEEISVESKSIGSRRSQQALAEQCCQQVLNRPVKFL